MSLVKQELQTILEHLRSPWLRRGFAPGFVNYKKGCTRLATASDKVYQLLAHGRWFFPASSTTKNWSPWYSWNIAESGVKTPKINQINQSIQLMNITAKVCGFNIDTWRSVLDAFPFLPCYNWNIVESGDKQPLPNHKTLAPEFTVLFLVGFVMHDL